MKIPDDLLYTKEHEWVKIESDTALMGITDHAQGALGDITFVELPASGTEVAQSAFCATVESVKAASDVYAPLSGTVTEVNSQLGEHPELVNQSPYGTGWMVRIKVRDPAEKATLLSAKDYAAYLETLA